MPPSTNPSIVIVIVMIIHFICLHFQRTLHVRLANSFESFYDHRNPNQLPVGQDKRYALICMLPGNCGEWMAYILGLHQDMVTLVLN